MAKIKSNNAINDSMFQKIKKVAMPDASINKKVITNLGDGKLQMSDPGMIKKTMRYLGDSQHGKTRAEAASMGILAGTTAGIVGGVAVGEDDPFLADLGGGVLGGAAGYFGSTAGLVLGVNALSKRVR